MIVETGYARSDAYLLSVDERRQFQRHGEQFGDYARRARADCRRIMRKLEATGAYDGRQDLLVDDTLRVIERVFMDLGTHGVERIKRGKNRKSPAIVYLNSGDSYGLTIMHVHNRFIVGNWGSWVESGKYD